MCAAFHNIDVASALVRWNHAVSVGDKIRVDISLFSDGFIPGGSVWAVVLLCRRRG